MYLKNGDSGPDVVALQTKLNYLGLDLGPSGIDGKFGEYTKNAVMFFQRSWGLSVDGIYGDITHDFLNSKMVEYGFDVDVIDMEATKDEVVASIEDLDLTITSNVEIVSSTVVATSEILNKMLKTCNTFIRLGSADYKDLLQTRGNIHIGLLSDSGSSVLIDTHSNVLVSYGKSNYTGTYDLPGYSPAWIEIELPNKKTASYCFLISPQSFQDSRGNDVSIQKTGVGYFIYRLGPSLVQLSLSGFLVDSKSMKERSVFTEVFFKNFIMDQLETVSNTVVDEIPLGGNYFTKFINENKISLYLEGSKYTGQITNLILSKSTNSQFIYQYSIQFLVVEDRFVAPNYSDADYIKAYLNVGSVTAPGDDNTIDIATLTTFIDNVTKLSKGEL